MPDTGTQPCVPPGWKRSRPRSLSIPYQFLTKATYVRASFGLLAKQSERCESEQHRDKREVMHHPLRNPCPRIWRTECRLWGWL